MASRPVWTLITLAVGASAALAAPAEGPTPLERILQKRYLDHYFLLRADVKVQRVKTETVVSSTVGGLPQLEETRPITLVTEGGVFYAGDYDSQSQLNMNVRSGPAPSTARDDPALQNEALVAGGTVGSVLQVDRTAQVAIPEGNLVRVIGVQEVPHGVQVMLEAFQGQGVPVMVRGADAEEEPPDARAAHFKALFDALCIELPGKPEERLAWVDPAWSETVQTAIRAGRVEAGMTPLQVVLAWGNPVFITRDAESQVDIWLYKRGATLLEQMRNQVNVYFAAGQVAEIDVGPTR